MQTAIPTPLVGVIQTGLEPNSPQRLTPDVKRCFGPVIVIIKFSKYGLPKFSFMFVYK